MNRQSPSISGAMIRDVHLCERKVALDIHGDPADRDPVSPFTSMLWREGLAHEEEVFGGLGDGVADFRGLERRDRELGTLRAMEDGANVILGSVIEHADLIGMPDVLRRTSTGYLAQDVKSGAALEGPRRNYKKDYLVQVAHYAHILERSGLGRGDVAGIIGRSGAETAYDLSAPLGRERVSGAELHLRLLDLARDLRASPDAARGALSAACSMCEWKTRCRRELAAADDLTRIAGLGRAIREPIEAIAKTVSALAALDPAALGAVPGVGAERLRRLADRARLLADPAAGPIVREPLRLVRPAYAIDFDVEADPLRNLVYLHGFWHVAPDGTREFTHFFAETANEDGEKAAFARAIEHFRSHRSAHWFHYSQYERTAYRQLQRRHPDVCGEDEIDVMFAAERCTDVYAIVAARTDWPLGSYGIKAIAVACGFSWDDADPGGANSVEWYDRFVTTGDPALRDRIVAYNRDDVRASEVVRDALHELETTGLIRGFRR